MDNKSIKRLTEFLEMECDDYGIKYSYEWNSNTECFDVKLIYYENTVELKFRYDSEKDDLSMRMYEDVFETVREFDYTVKYFWMRVSPAIWTYA